MTSTEAAAEDNELDINIATAYTGGAGTGPGADAAAGETVDDILDQLQESFRMPDGIEVMASKDAKKKASTKKKKTKGSSSKKDKKKSASADGDGDGNGNEESPKKKKTTKKTKSKKTSSKKSGNAMAEELGLTVDSDEEEEEVDDEDESMDIVGELNSSVASLDLIKSPESVTKKKGKKKKKGSSKEDALHASILGIDESFMSPPTSSKSKVGGGLVPLLESPTRSPEGRKKLSDTQKYSVEYFQTILDEVSEKCVKKIKFKQPDRDAFQQACAGYYETWWGQYENERWLDDLLAKQEKKPDSVDPEEIKAAQAYLDHSNQSLPKHKNHCIGKALKLFNQIDEDKMDALEDKLVKGAIIAQATPQSLADFASKGKENEKLIKRLFQDPKLMKDMLRHGGASKYDYGSAMKIYVNCLGEDFLDQEAEERKKKAKKQKSGGGGDNDDDHDDHDDDDHHYENEEEYNKATEKWLEKAWGRVNKKIALACALELCAPVYEFDTTTPIDPVSRYKHFAEAHKKGDLDPAFPYFSVWEMRQIVNCDAPNEQMQWCRDMVFNYVPHLTCLTDLKLRYVYMLQSDVRLRKPEWTGSPRTYPMVLSGGGNESINSWFGRFLIKSFGLPAWGSKYRRKEGFCMWTHDGWEAMNGADWDNCTWKGKSGKDFKTEIEARNKAPPEEYFKKLVTLQCLADVVDEGDPRDIPDYELDVLHPNRLWRSMSLVSLELLFRTEPEVERTFERKGRGLVETRCQKYLAKYELDAPDADISKDPETGFITIPASRHGFSDGNIIVVESYDGGKQFNFIADGVVEYEFPEEDVAETKKYSLTVEVCTVSSKQTSLTVSIGARRTPIKIPYTNGQWKFTEEVEIDVPAGATLKVSRPKGSLGVAIKQFIFE